MKSGQFFIGLWPAGERKDGFRTSDFGKAALRMQRFFIGLCTGGFEKTKGLYPCQSQWSDFPRGFLPTCRVGCPILQMSEPMTYHFHRNYLKIFAERLPLQGWAFHSAHFRLVRSYDPSVCSADSSPSLGSLEPSGLYGIFHIACAHPPYIIRAASAALLPDRPDRPDLHVVR